MNTDLEASTKKTQTKSTETKKILIVEDESALSKALSLKLTNSGFEAEVASDGGSAMEKVKKNKYDLIILDLVLPDKNGFEILEEIKEIEGFTTPVFVVSNLSQDEDIQKVLDLGAKKYFTKSNISLSEIVREIKEYK